jgi:type II secretory pathway predicted ATPase ExeA
MQRDQGLVLVTGPTGSGKTTTLYALLNSVNDEGVNIQTIEDPSNTRSKASIRRRRTTPVASISPMACAPSCVLTRTSSSSVNHAMRKPPWRR